MNKKIAGFLFFCIMSIPFFCFEWPQKEVKTSDIFAWFGDTRESAFCNALVFSSPSEISASESGRIIAVMGTENGEDGWFESPLGNAILISHSNEMLTVYANLEKTTIDNEKKLIKAGSPIGISGSSGWQKGKSALEFQVIDKKLQTFINPILLMPQKKIEQPFKVRNLIAKSRNGDTYRLSHQRRLPAGIYTLYCSNDQKQMPYSTTVSINGAAAETIAFDTLIPHEYKLCSKGKRYYSFADTYPDKKNFLLSEIILSRGANTLNVTSADSTGKETHSYYYLTVK